MYLINIMIRNLFSLFKCPIQSILENLYVLPQEVILQQFERKLHNDFILSKQENYVFQMFIILDPETPTLVLYLPQVTSTEKVSSFRLLYFMLGCFIISNGMKHHRVVIPNHSLDKVVTNGEITCQCSMYTVANVCE